MCLLWLPGFIDVHGLCLSSFAYQLAAVLTRGLAVALCSFGIAERYRWKRCEEACKKKVLFAAYLPLVSCAQVP